MESSADEVLGNISQTEELLDLMKKCVSMAGELVRENEQLRGRVAGLDRTADTPCDEPPTGEIARLREENRRLRDEVVAVDVEQRHFARRCIEVEAQNEALANLYVATCQLHGSLETDGVLKSIEDIIVGLIGAKDWAIFLRDGEAGDFMLAAGNGVAERLTEGRLEVGTGHEGRAVASGRVFVGEAGTPEEQTAYLPLVERGECLGMIAIYRMLGHKLGAFTVVDRELLDLLASQAGAAIVSSRLMSASARPMQAM